MDLKINYNNSLSDALLDEKYVFVAYVATFVLVGEYSLKDDSFVWASLHVGAINVVF